MWDSKVKTNQKMKPQNCLLSLLKLRHSFKWLKWQKEYFQGYLGKKFDFLYVFSPMEIYALTSLFGYWGSPFLGVGLSSELDPPLTCLPIKHRIVKSFVNGSWHKKKPKSAAAVLWCLFLSKKKLTKKSLNHLNSQTTIWLDFTLIFKLLNIFFRRIIQVKIQLENNSSNWLGFALFS